MQIKATSDKNGESFGTGEIVDKLGYIVTNAHVVTFFQLGEIKKFDKYYMKFYNDSEFVEVTLEKYDTEQDSALLKIKSLSGIKLKAITFGTTEKLTHGDRVFAIGNAVNYGLGIFSRHNKHSAN